MYIDMCCLSLIEATEKLKQQSGGAFEQLFSPVRGEFEQKFPKIQMPRFCPRGGGVC